MLYPSLNICHWESSAAPNILGILHREYFRRFNGTGQPVQLCEKRIQAVTGTLLIDFWVTPSCVTAVTDNTFCQTCCFPSCYCVVLQYHVLMSDTLLNAFSLEVFFFFFCLARTLCSSRVQQLKHAGKPLIWVIVWIIVRVVIIQKVRLCFCACVSKREKGKENQSRRGSERERERPHLCSPWDGIFMDGWAWWGLRTHKESFSVCCRQLTMCACLLNFQ